MDIKFIDTMMASPKLQRRSMIICLRLFAKKGGTALEDALSQELFFVLKKEAS